MAVHNGIEILTRSVFEDAYVRNRRLVCNCEQCKDDILAIALNNLPCRYVSTAKGDAYVKAEFFTSQLQSDILQELAKAAEIVGKRPRHSLNNEATCS